MSEIKRNGHGAMDMTQGSPTRLIVLFSLPLLAGNVLQQLYNMVDSMVVGRFVGEDALAAVGSSFPVVFLSVAIAAGMSMGCTVVISQFSRSFFADSSYMLSFSVLCSCVCSRLISPSVSSWHKQDNTLMHQSPGHIQRRTPYNF